MLKGLGREAALVGVLVESSGGQTEAQLPEQATVVEVSAVR